MFKPIGDKVLILPETEGAEVIGGIHIPQRARQESCRGTVKAVGNTVTDVKPGDAVLYTKYGVESNIVLNKVVHYLIRQSEIIAVVG